MTVPPSDDLPYVFELEQGQRLALSFRASEVVDVVICPEGAYDAWVDDGMIGDPQPNSTSDGFRPVSFRVLRGSAERSVRAVVL